MIEMQINDSQLSSIISSLGKLKIAFQEEPPKMIDKLADAYRKSLIYNITSQVYSGTYDPLSPLYQKWKDEHGGEKGFWMLWKSLIDSISIVGVSNDKSVGVDKGAMPSKGSSMFGGSGITPVWIYALSNEFGRKAFSKGKVSIGAIKERPLFRPSFNDFRIKQWPEIVQQTFLNIVRNW